MIAPAQIPNPYVKPKWQASVGIMESVVAYNCRKYGMPRPVLAMPMWECAGNRVFDYSRHGNHGAITGAGWVADGLDFVATDNNYVKILDTVDPTEYSISVFLKPDDVTSANIILRTDSDKSPSTSHSHELLISDVGRFCHYLYDGSTKLLTGSTTAVSGNKYRIVGTAKNNDYMKLYINGIEDGTPIGINTLWTGGDRWNLGINSGQPTLSGFFDGLIYEICIYNTVLTASQIKFITDNPYFMYQMPEELYGYSPAAVGAIMNQFQKANIGADLYNGAIIA